MNLPIIDLIFLGIILVCAIVALIRGFINELFGMGVPVISAWVAILFYSRLVPVFDPLVKIHVLAVVISFLIFFAGIFIILKILQLLIKKIFSAKIFTSLDRILGFVFGLVEGLAIVAIVLIILSAQSWFDVSELLNGSIFYKMLSGVLAVPVEGVVNTVNSVSSNAVLTN